MPVLEVIALSVADAQEAQAGGANSLELNAHIEVGGLTPSLDVVKAIRDAVTIDIHVMVRPHAHSFRYSQADREAIFATLDALKPLGITGVVFGALQADNTLDVALIQTVAHEAQSLILTMHRALDDTPHPTHALVALKGIAGRILSSGGARNIWDGRDQTRQWVQDYGDDFSFVCAGGVTMDNMRALVTHTGAQEFHTGSAVRRPQGVQRALVAEIKRRMLGEDGI